MGRRRERVHRPDDVPRARHPERAHARRGRGGDRLRRGRGHGQVHRPHGNGALAGSISDGRTRARGEAARHAADGGSQSPTSAASFAPSWAALDPGGRAPTFGGVWAIRLDGGFPAPLRHTLRPAGHDRKVLLTRAFASAVNGSVVLCDRYPSADEGAPDGAQLGPPGATANEGRLRRWLIEREARLYRAIVPPDLAIYLTAPLETTSSEIETERRWSRKRTCAHGTNGAPTSASKESRFTGSEQIARWPRCLPRSGSSSGRPSEGPDRRPTALACPAPHRA